MSAASAPVVAVTSTAGLARALAGAAEWLWCLAPGARAAEGAQSALLAAAERDADGGRPALVAGMVLGADGRPADWALPAAATDDLDALLSLVERRLCPLRWAPLHNCLLDRAVVAGYGAPDQRAFGPYAGVEWTARVLADHRGRFCADAVATLPAEARAPGGPALLGATLRTARSGAWTRGESLQAFAACRRAR
jgi:hypothetical protein